MKVVKHIEIIHEGILNNWRRKPTFFYCILEAPSVIDLNDDLSINTGTFQTVGADSDLSVSDIRENSRAMVREKSNYDGQLSSRQSRGGPWRNHRLKEVSQVKPESIQ